MTSRREFFGKAATGVLAAPLLPEVAAQAVQRMSYPPGLLDPPTNLIWTEAQQAARAFLHRYERRQQYLNSARMGAMDPDIAGMRSWSPSYRVLQMADRIQATEAFFQSLRDSIWGKNDS